MHSAFVKAYFILITVLITFLFKAQWQHVRLKNLWTRDLSEMWTAIDKVTEQDNNIAWCVSQIVNITFCLAYTPLPENYNGQTVLDGQRTKSF